MRLARLWLTDFRCYEAIEFEPGEAITVVTGGNAQGKTSLLEAVGWLARLSSFRGVSDGVLVRRGCERAVVRGEVGRSGVAAPDAGTEDRPTLIEAEIPVAGRNRVLVNRAPIPRARELLGILRVTVFAPDDLRLVKGGPAERRRELDDLLVACSPRYDAVRSDYERVLRHRNAWLRTWSRNDDPTTLDVFDEQLARVGAELVRGRLKLVERLAVPLEKAYGDVAATAARVSGVYEAAWAGDDSLDVTVLDGVEPQLRAAVAASRTADQERRMSLVGPHRDEWRLSVNGLDARRYASQGEQRSLTLALRLAGHQVVSDVVGDSPVLLFDDVFSELDDDRAAGLVAHLPAGQALVTTAGALPTGLEADAVVWVTEGRLEPGGPHR